MTFAALAVALSALVIQQDTSWTRQYRADLDSLRATIQADHPGAIDEENPAFARALTAAYQEALAAAPRATTYNAYRYYLTRFVNSFQDAHLNVGFKRPFDDMRFAGLNVTYRGGRFVIVAADSTYPAKVVNAVIEECDGVPATKHFHDRVLSWRGRPTIEADLYRLAPLFFIDYGRPTPAPPTACRLSTGGASFSQSLTWTPVTVEQLGTRMQTTAVVPQLGLKRLAGDSVIWINVPTFAVNKEPEVSVMRALIDSVAAVSNQKWRLLVFDLRGNSGGSSSWGDALAGALFGTTWRKQAADWLFDGVYTDWRVSRGNIENSRGVLQQIAGRDGESSGSYRAQKAFIDSMEAALRRGQQYYAPSKNVRTGVEPPQPVPVPGKVVVISGATCFSACLDFLDRFRLHPSVVHAGQITGVDTNYMENWGHPISEFVSISHPMKVYRNRRRANNQAYEPHVRYEEDLYDTPKLQSWVLERFR